MRARLLTLGFIVLLAAGLSIPELHASLPPERATYDATGRLLSLLQGGSKLPVGQELSVTFQGSVTASLQPADRPPALKRDGSKTRWQGEVKFPNGGTATVALDWQETGSGVTLDAALSALSRLDTTSVDCVLDLPRAEFTGGRLEPAGVDLPAAKPAQVDFYTGSTDTLDFADTARARHLALHFDRPLPVTVTDRWDAAGRSFRVRINLHAGEWSAGETVKFHAAFALSGPEATAPAANVHVDPASPRYTFDGYGGNYCWGEQPAVETYLLDHLQHAWTRHELKARDWDRERARPGPALVRDFEQMAAMQRRGIPWILTVWNLPQRFYADANQHPPDRFFHPIADRYWEDLLDLIGSCLLYLKEHYQAEPDLFSFNEPDLGIYVGQTPWDHRDAIRRLGAHFAKLGLKTKLVLGDTSDARGTHTFVLAAAADAEAMRYIGALSFHSWRPTTPAQYEAWADVADWLHLPLLVGEAGVDPDAYYSRTFDSYDYGLSEAAQQQDLLRYARPSASIFWQYTTDYGLAHAKPDGTVEPTSRFYLLKHFTDLTPRRSQVLASATNRADVTVSAFRSGDAMTVHLLNLGPACTVNLTGLPPGPWRTVTTTETVDYAEGTLEVGATTTLPLPARGLVSLVHPAH